MEITGAQSRLARALLGWSAANIAKAAGVSLSTVQRFEAGGKAIASVKRSIAGAIEAVGVELIEGGARMRAPK